MLRDAARTLTAAGLSRLLARLHVDPAQAAAEYEHLRRTLIRFFDWRGASPPDECADIAIDRLAKRLEDETPVGDVRAYALGIARLVLLERRRMPIVAGENELPDVAAAAESPPADRLTDCFDRCLARLDDDERSLLLAYYEGERRSKIANRRQLAAARGLSDNALRSRVQRLRDRLERCVSACVSSWK